MPCFHPLPAWKSRRLSDSGKRGITFKLSDAFKDMPVELPCGKCVGCVQARANEWAMRCEHEAKLYKDNWFVTLTYRPESLPDGGSLVPKHLQDFWKRLRKRYDGVRYFACGEYGENFHRPHYHALLFNFRPSDLVSRERVMDGQRVFDSKELAEIWGHGSIQIAPFSGATAQYVTNYVRKNFSVGGKAVDFGSVVKPFQVMSRRPGIGKKFLAQYLHDIYPAGVVVAPGGGMRRAPRFYDLTLEKSNARLYRQVKRRRKEIATHLGVDKRGSRLYTVEEVVERRQKFYDGIRGRPYEKE
ncbi:putative VP4 [Microviridae sp.]|nr:putative VP4 [Microviridae sp.]